MATSYGAMLRPAAVISRARSHVRSTRKALSRFARPQAFSLPPDAEAAAVRAVRNLRSFRAYYAALLWVLLLASLAPRRRASMLFLMAASKVALLYEVVLRAAPGPSILHRILDRRVVFGVFLLVVLAELAATRALGNLGAAAAVGLPIVGLHAVFRARDDLGEEGGEKDEGEKKDGDLESGSSQ